VIVVIGAQGKSEQAPTHDGRDLIIEWTADL